MITDKIAAAGFGIIGGLAKFFMNAVILDVTFFGRFIEAGATAFACGFLGVAGKHFFDLIKRKLFTKNKTS